jgi:hypothetical protein
MWIISINEYSTVFLMLCDDWHVYIIIKKFILIYNFLPLQRTGMIASIIILLVLLYSTSNSSFSVQQAISNRGNFIIAEQSRIAEERDGRIYRVYGCA